MRTINLVLKRLMDIFGSLIGITLLLPVLIIVSLAIKIDSKGPVFFRQERLGKKGKVFKIIKFRTMVVNAEKLGDGLSVNSDSDYRITKFGRVLRKLSLDELPQLINVFMGNMSLVGPRPPVIYYPYKGFGNYPEKYKIRFDMKPGITGLSQVKERNNTNWQSRIIMDISYIEKFNIFLDFWILLKTVKSVFKSENIYKEK